MASFFKVWIIPLFLKVTLNRAFFLARFAAHWNIWSCSKIFHFFKKKISDIFDKYSYLLCFYNYCCEKFPVHCSESKLKTVTFVSKNELHQQVLKNSCIKNAWVISFLKKFDTKCMVISLWKKYIYFLKKILYLTQCASSPHTYQSVRGISEPPVQA